MEYLLYGLPSREYFSSEYFVFNSFMSWAIIGLAEEKSFIYL
jgi:hypothetical protein